MTGPSASLGTLLTRLLYAVGTPTVAATYFCFVRSWSRSAHDHVPIEFIRVDLNALWPLALGGAVIGAFLSTIFMASTSRRFRSEVVLNATTRVRLQRFVIGMAVVSLVFALWSMAGLPASWYLAAAATTSSFLIAMMFAVAAMSALRARWAKHRAIADFETAPLVGAVVRRIARPFRGKGRLVDALAADPIARLSRTQFLGIASVLYVSVLAIIVGYQDSQSTSFRIVLVPHPEVVLRSYNDEIVTAPIDIATETVTMKYSKRRLTTDKESLAMYNLFYSRPIKSYVADPKINALVEAARAKSASPARRH